MMMMICPQTLSVPRSKQFSESVARELSEHIFAPNEGYCVYNLSNTFCNTRSFENWDIFSKIVQF